MIWWEELTHTGQKIVLTVFGVTFLILWHLSVHTPIAESRDEEFNALSECQLKTQELTALLDREASIRAQRVSMFNKVTSLEKEKMPKRNLVQLWLGDILNEEAEKAQVKILWSQQTGRPTKAINQTELPIFYHTTGLVVEARGNLTGAYTFLGNLQNRLPLMQLSEFSLTTVRDASHQLEISLVIEFPEISEHPFFWR